MKRLQILLLHLFIMLGLAPSHAATDQTTMKVNVSYQPYVKFVGSAPNSDNYYDNNDISNWIFPSVVDIGTLGLESNLGGNCDINFTTVNNFQLIHIDSGSLLTKYKLLYESQEFSGTNNPTLSIPCTSVPTGIQFTPTQLVFGNLFSNGALIEAGTYRDVITVVVSTQ